MTDNSKFTNYANVIGKVDSYGFNENVKDGKTLGNFIVKAKDDRVFFNLFNPNKAREAGRNVVKDFFDKFEEGDKIEISGNINEREWEGDIKRNVSPMISSENGVIGYEKLPKDSEITEKATLALEGDVLSKNLMYDSLDRFHGKNTAITELEIAYFSFYNPETKKQDRTRQEVLLNVLNNFYQYNKKNGNDFIDYEHLGELKEKLESDDSVINVHKVLKDFSKHYSPRMFNIDIITVVAYNIAESTESNGIAETIANKVEVHDNIGVGCIISNKMKVDEFGFVDGNVNEIEIKKFRGINESFGKSDDDFGFNEDLDEGIDEDDDWDLD